MRSFQQPTFNIISEEINALILVMEKKAADIHFIQMAR